MSDSLLEKTLWATADKLRNNMDAAEYKHIVLGLIFLKYISDVFEKVRQVLLIGEGENAGADPEDSDEYLAKNAFFVPEKARWTTIQAQAKQPIIGQLIDEAMDALEAQNDSLRGVLPKEYAKPNLDKQRLGELVDLISTIGFGGEGHAAKDLLGRVYEYFLGMFADAEGKRGGQFYTPEPIVALLVEMLEPYRGRVYDGCCGSGGMFVQSEKFLLSHGGNVNNLSIFGQESNPTTYRLARMNLTIRGINAKIELGDTFTNDRHPDLKADYILANPPFNISDWQGDKLRDDRRWQYGTPPEGNANYAWIQHFLSKLSPNGVAGIVLANGAMTSTAGSEGTIRKTLIDNSLIDCMVALPSQLFYNTQIPACLFFLAKNRKGGRIGSADGLRNLRNRSNEVLFIDARKMGIMINRRNRTLPPDELQRIADTYHNWRSQEPSLPYADEAGFCKAATLEEIAQNNYVLTPGRYVGTEEAEEETIPFAERMEELTVSLAQQLTKGDVLNARIRENLSTLGFNI